jgi:hypothetical protein
MLRPESGRDRRVCPGFVQRRRRGALYRGQGRYSRTPPPGALSCTYRTCPVHFSGRARANLGRAAGRDRFPPDVTCPLHRGQGRFPRRPSPGALCGFRFRAAGSTFERSGINFEKIEDFDLEDQASGLDCLTCIIFARQRLALPHAG